MHGKTTIKKMFKNIHPNVLLGNFAWFLNKTRRNHCLKIAIYYGHNNKKLHNEELNDLYSSPNVFRVFKSRRMRWTGHVARMGERRGAYRVFLGKPEGKRQLGRPKRRWEDNINMDLKQVGWEGMDWIDLAPDRDRWRVLVNAVVNLRVT
jgi:hypothetical protein